jgi:hypothetical protein
MMQVFNRAITNRKSWIVKLLYWIRLSHSIKYSKQFFTSIQKAYKYAF